MATKTTAKLKFMETAMGMHSLTPQERMQRASKLQPLENQNAAVQPTVAPIRSNENTQKDCK
nr:hypothetical protein [uncultured Albidiferax sp.]